MGDKLSLAVIISSFVVINPQLLSADYTKFINPIAEELAQKITVNSKVSDLSIYNRERNFRF